MSTFCVSSFFPSRRSLPFMAIASVFVLLTGCQSVTANDSKLQTSAALTPAVQAVIGDYATEGYDKRQQGYDWVGVRVRPFGDAEIDIKIRARADLKKPSCHFDGQAKLMGQDTVHGIIFQTIANDSVTFLQFKAGKLVIDSQDKYALHYFCSGGATLAGEYQKLTGDLKFNEGL